MADSASWMPSASIAMLKRRAQLLADVRHFFATRGVMEVDTPILSAAAPTAPYLDSFATQLHDVPYYLQTSPEFAMKRLLAAGSGAIYQIAKVFRHGESGRRHNPEFTMLEWYRPALSLSGLIDEVDALLQQLLDTPPAQRMRYRTAMQQYAACDPWQMSDIALADIVSTRLRNWPLDKIPSRDNLLDVIMSQLVEPALAKLNTPVIITDFPPEQAQLAKLTTDSEGNTIAARFEVYAGGIELANGYDELQDTDVLATRFTAENTARQVIGKPMMPIDQHLLSAMQHGLPACTGVAVGLDRLLMLLTQAQDIKTVLGFDSERA